MSLYPKRDMFGGARYARMVRDERGYWVEWVFVSDADDEVVTALRPSSTPANALDLARLVIKDMRRQDADGEWYRDDEEGGIERFVATTGGYSEYWKVLFAGNSDSEYTSSLPIEEFEQQLDSIPDPTSNRWMLIE